MNDAEYVREAVELAKGWDIAPSADRSTEYVVILVGDDVDDWFLDRLPQHILDALAAQLVRQVDAIDDPVILMINPGITNICEPDGSVSSDGPDRTLNTIKAVVDSKVVAKKGTK